MQLTTTKFGTIEVSPEQVIQFTSGLLGFEMYTKYVLLSLEDSSFSFLQSVEEPSLAFVLIRPELLRADYRVELDRHNIEELQFTDASEGQVYAIVTVPENIQQMTANLQAPVVINTKKKLAKQVVLMDGKYHTKHNVLEEAQQQAMATKTATTEEKLRKTV